MHEIGSLGSPFLGRGTVGAGDGRTGVAGMRLARMALPSSSILLFLAKADKSIGDREPARLPLVCPKAIVYVKVMVWCPWAVDGPIVRSIPSVVCLHVDVLCALADELDIFVILAGSR